MDSFQFLESHWEIELYITGGIGIVGEIQVVVKAVVRGSQAEGTVPFHSAVCPEFIPFHFITWLDKELHLHLLKFAHPDNKLTPNNLIPECFSDLGNPKRDF